MKWLKTSEFLVISRSWNLLYLKVSRAMLMLDLNRIRSIRRIDWRPPEYKLCRIFRFISSVYQMAIVLIKNMGKCIKSFAFVSQRDI